MEKLKVMIAESDEKERERMQQYFANSEEFELTHVTEDGEQAEKMAIELRPSVIISNLALQNTDGLTLAERVKKAISDTKVVMLSSAFTDHSIRRMVDFGVDYYMLRPFNMENLCNQIRYMTAPQKKVATTTAAKVLGDFRASTEQGTDRKLEERISNIFIMVGIPAHIKGYQFLREAVRLTIESPEIINSITKQLYPSIAKRFSTTASKVERAIRHAIEVGWNRGKIENINTLFGIKVYGAKDKPTNGEFIALVADKMLLEGA
jgi:two-component system response regulator (stage 0 sporulation protein A)